MSCLICQSLNWGLRHEDGSIHARRSSDWFCSLWIWFIDRLTCSGYRLICGVISHFDPSVLFTKSTLGYLILKFKYFFYQITFLICFDKCLLILISCLRKKFVYIANIIHMVVILISILVIDNLRRSINVLPFKVTSQCLQNWLNRVFNSLGKQSPSSLLIGFDLDLRIVCILVAIRQKKNIPPALTTCTVTS